MPLADRDTQLPWPPANDTRSVDIEVQQSTRTVTDARDNCRLSSRSDDAHRHVISNQGPDDDTEVIAKRRTLLIMITLNCKAHHHLHTVLAYLLTSYVFDCASNPSHAWSMAKPSQL